jgi:hypothetical protein
LCQGYTRDPRFLQRVLRLVMQVYKNILVDSTYTHNNILYGWLGLRHGYGDQTNILNSSRSKAKKKRVDYEINNYCGIKYPKDILTCSDCNHRIRTTGWHSRKEADKKRI